MKRILFLSPNIGVNGGGAERQIVTVASLLKDNGYDIDFLCYCEGDFYAKILEEHNIKIHWKIFSNYVKRLFSIRKFIRENRYDVVISFQDTPNFLNCFAAVGGKKWKVITSERSAKEDLFYTTKGKIFAWFQRYSDYIVCNSENAKRMWVKHSHNYKNKIHVIYNSVYIKDIEVNKEYVPKKDNKLHIVVLASYQYLKNPIGLINAISSMSDDERSRFVIDWYGNHIISNMGSKCYDEASKLVKEHNLHNVIHLNKKTEFVNEVISVSDFVALFSSVEGLPNSICEGMTMGKPIIMSRVSDYEVLVDKDNGFLCDWDNSESIKNAITMATCLDNDEIIKQGNNSQIKAKYLFSNDAVVKKWIDLIG